MFLPLSFLFDFLPENGAIVLGACGACMREALTFSAYTVFFSFPYGEGQCKLSTHGLRTAQRKMYIKGNGVL